MNLRDIPVDWHFIFPDEPDMRFKVIAGAEPGKDRVTVMALDTGLTIAPTFIYAGDEQVRFASFAS